jgi:TonB family protein
MKTPLIAMSLLAALSLQSVPVPAAAGDCNLHTLQSSTLFPIRSQLRGQSGTVLVKVSVDRTGRATTTQLVQSSGFRLLDRAATTSIRDRWQFDTSGCERKDLPATRTVAVEYRNDEYGG